MYKVFRNIKHTVKHLIVFFVLVYSFQSLCETSTEDKNEIFPLCNQNHSFIRQVQEKHHNFLQTFQETVANKPNNGRLTKRNLYDGHLKKIEETASGKYILEYDSRMHFNYTTADGDHPLEFCDYNRHDGLLAFTNFCYHSLNLKNFFMNIYFNKINIKELAFQLIVWNCEEGVDWSYGWHDELPFLFLFRGDGLDADADAVIVQCRREIGYIKEAVFSTQEFISTKIEYENKIKQLQAQKAMHNRNISQYYEDILKESTPINDLCSLHQSIVDIDQNRDKIQTQLNAIMSRYDMPNTSITQLINNIKSNLSEHIPEEALLRKFVVELEKNFSWNSQKNQISLLQLQNFFNNNTQAPFLYETIHSIILDSNNKMGLLQKRITNTQKEVVRLNKQINRMTNYIESLSLDLSRKLYGGNVAISSYEKIRLYKLLAKMPAFSMRFHIRSSYHKRGPWGW